MNWTAVLKGYILSPDLRLFYAQVEWSEVTNSRAGFPRYAHEFEIVEVV